MAKPFKPPPISDQIISTINPVNWFSGLIWSNVIGDIEYHLNARDHRKVQGLPPISPVDIKESAGFGPAGLSIDPNKWFKYGFANGFKGQAKNLLKISLTLNELDAHSDWIHGWKPKLIQEEKNTNPLANELGLVRKKTGPTGEVLEGWIDSVNATEDERQSRLKLYNQLEWWTKTEDIKAYRDLAWKPIMESAIEATYFTAKRQKNEGKITKAEFDHFESEFDRVVNKKLKTSVRSTAGNIKSFKGYQASLDNTKGMFTNDSGTRDNYYKSIQADQDYNTELHQLFKQVVGGGHGGHGHGIINLERDADGVRLLENLRTLDHGESHFAWKDFLQKFDKGGTLRDYVWDSLSSADLIRIAEPIYALVTGGKIMSPKTYKTLGRISQIGSKTFPFNAGLIIASIANKTGYLGLSKGIETNFIKFNNFAFLEFKDKRFGWSGFGAPFKASQFEGVLWNKGKKEDSLYKLINDGNKYKSSATYFKELTEDQVAEISRLLLTPDQIVAKITTWLDPSLSAKDRAEFLAKLTDRVNKYKTSEGFLTLQRLESQGKLKDYELFQFLSLADTKGLSSQYQGFVGFASKLPDQFHNLLQTWSSEVWKLPGFKQLFPLWSKYKVNQLFFNNALTKGIQALISKLFLAFGSTLGGPLGTIVAYLFEDLFHKFIHNIWASLTGGHPHAIIGDNAKKMLIIGCAIVLAIFALPIFIIIIILGGAFALFTGGNNSADEVVANQDVTIIVKNLDTPINTIANNTTSAQQTTFDITVQNNLDKEITVLSVTISEYSEESYWQGVKTITYDKQIANNIKIGANDEQTTTISLPFYNAVKGGEEGRLIYLTIGATYVQTDGGAGSAGGYGNLLLGKINQPVGTPVQIRSLLHPFGGIITQCYGHNGHTGLDIGIYEGTALHSTLAGEVRVCNFISDPDESCPGFTANSGYGNMIMVSNGTYTILYAHLKPIPNTPSGIVDGVQVNLGDIIAYSGNTGNSTGPHVHYEVRLGHFGGSVIDPMHFAENDPCKN